MAHCWTGNAKSTETSNQTDKDSAAATLLPESDNLNHMDWADKIALAKRAREFGNKIREGKPKTFNKIPGLRSR